MRTLSLTSIFLHLFLFISAQQIDVYQRPVQHERSREFDAIHYRIALDVDMENKMLSGSNTITLRPLNDDFKTIYLDAVSLIVTDVMDIKGFPLSFHQTDDKLSITLSAFIFPSGYSDCIGLLYAKRASERPEIYGCYG